MSTFSCVCWPSACLLWRNVLCPFVFKSSPEGMFREEGGERQRGKGTLMWERNINQLIAFHSPPDQGWNPQPRYAPWPGIKPANFWCTGRCSNQLSHLAMDSAHYVFVIELYGFLSDRRVSGGGRRYWASMCAVWPWHSKWLSKWSNESAPNFVLSLKILPWKLFGWFRGCSYGQLVMGSFITTMHPLTHPLSGRVFCRNIKSPRWLSPPMAQIWHPVTSYFSQN